MTCSREHEVRESIERGHWPSATTQDLQAHVAACPRCADLVLVAQAFRNARANAMAQAPLTAPGALWWKAQVRRRQRAMQQIERPLVGAQIFAAVVTALVAIGLAVWATQHGLSWQTGAKALHLDTLLPAVGSGASIVPLAVCLCVLALLGGVALYLGIESKTERR